MENFETNTGSGASSEFERLLNSSFADFKPGKIITGRVTHIGKDYVTVDIDYKSEGVVPSEQFITSDGQMNAKIGDVVEVLLVSVENDSGQVVLSKEKALQMKVWKEVEDKFVSGETLTGRVLQLVKGGLLVDIGIPAFLPGSQVDIKPHKNLEKFIGETFDFKVLKITKEKGNIVLSRRAVLASEREQLKNETLKVISEGVVMEGVVKNITDYGAFVDLGGVDGLLHITDMSWGHINHPSQRLSIGQTVPVVVIKYDGEKQRVSLGMKQLTPDPWVTVSDKFMPGAKVIGRVVQANDQGVTVELDEGIDGFIPQTEVSWTKKGKNPARVLSEGQKIEAKILSVNKEERRIVLSYKQLSRNPWDELIALHPVGSRVKGKVKSITDFGIFLGVTDEIDGLVHVSDFSWIKRIKDPKEIHELFKKNDTVEAVVLNIDVENQLLSLGVKQLEEDPWEKISQRFPIGTKLKGTVTSLTDFGVFVEIDKGVEGLIHSSHLGLEKDADPKQFFEAGKEVECEVIMIDKEERRISLSIKTMQAKRREKSRMGDEARPITFGDLMKDIGIGGKKE